MSKLTASKSPKMVLRVERNTDETEGAAVARTVLRPSTRAAISLTNIDRRGPAHAPLSDLIHELSTQCKSVIDGDLGRAEAILVTQAHTLDAIFHSLLLRAMQNQGEYLDAADRYYRLALRAQNQCRASLETLATIKNPPNVAFVKQANIGQAVQVNNGNAPVTSESRARELENEPNKLLEQTNGERLDIGATPTASATNSAVEAVGALHGAEVVKR